MLYSIYQLLHLPFKPQWTHFTAKPFEIMPLVKKLLPHRGHLLKLADINKIMIEAMKIMPIEIEKKSEPVKIWIVPIVGTANSINNNPKFRFLRISFAF